MSQKILIVGGTGMLGLPVARKMKEDGFEVTILTSNLAAAEERLGDQFELAYGDVTRPESLSAPIKGKDFVHLNLSAKLDPKLYEEIEIGGTANVAAASKEHGVKRISMISGASSKGEEEGIIFLDAKVKAERILINCGIPFTIMRASWFFEALPNFIQSGRAAVIGQQPIPRTWLAADDYARQVSTAFQTEAAANKCFYNLGPQRLTIMEALTAYCAKNHPELKPMTLPFAMARIAAFMPGQALLKKAIPFFKYFETRAEDCSSDEADRILGPNLTTLEEWLERQESSGD